MKSKLISIQRIFANMGKFIHNNGVREIDIVNWTAKALEFMNIESVFQPAVKIETVSQHQAQMPSFLHAVVQIARNNNYVNEPVVVESDVATILGETVDTPVALDRYGTPVNAYELAYYRPLPDFGSYFTIGSLNIKKYQFTPVRLANHSFFNSLVCKEPDFDGIYATCKDEYTVVDNLFRFSFPEGQVMISYLRQKLDENGYPMIPDEVSVIEAIEKFIRYKVFEEQFDNGREGAERRYSKAESDWHWYCRQAKTNDLIPQTTDEWQDIMDWKNHLMPKWNRYHGFFGALSHPQQLKM